MRIPYRRELKIIFNLLLLIIAGSAILFAAPPPQSIDLDGDGKSDSIVFEGKPGGNIFTVTVNGVRYDGDGDYISGRFAIVDIDSTDGLREIAIPEDGPSDDYATTFLIYRQGKIQKIGKIPGTYYLKTDGTGIIQTMVRGHILHTWFFPAVFVLDEKHTLHMVKQPLYLMKVPKMGFSGFTIGAECTAKSNFPLQASPTDSRIIATLTPGEKFTIVASDNKQWCIVQTGFGILCWFEVKRFNIVFPPGIEAENLMDGLCQAD